MGEAAEMLLDGTLCGTCGSYMDGEGDGFPRYCSAECDPHHEDESVKRALKAEGKKLAATINALIRKTLEKHFDATFEPEIVPFFDQQMGGVVRALYVNGNGKICHKGFLTTLENNRKQQGKKRNKQNAA